MSTQYPIVNTPEFLTVMHTEVVLSTIFHRWLFISVLMEWLMAAGIDDVALVAYGMKDVAALEMMWDMPY